MKYLLPITVAALLGSSNVALAQVPTETQAWSATINLQANLNPAKRMTPSEEEAFFKAYAVEYNKTWSPGPTERWDISVPASLYQQNDRLFAFDIFPPADGFRGWPAYSTTLTQIMRASSHFTVEPDLETFNYARNGNVVWFASAIDTKGVTREGIPYQQRGRQTVVLELIGDRWLVAHEHISAPFVPNSQK